MPIRQLKASFTFSNNLVRCKMPFSMLGRAFLSLHVREYQSLFKNGFDSEKFTRADEARES